MAIRTRLPLTRGIKKPTVLVLGVYLADRENTVSHIVSELAKSSGYVVDQRWIALFGQPPNEQVGSVTVKIQNERMSKYVLLNNLLATNYWRGYDYVLFVDDDVYLPAKFLDRFMDYQSGIDFALAQPSRTHNSFISHEITETVDGLIARQTRFVEIGPVVSMRKDAARKLLPYDESTPMGWGLDFVWPVIIENLGLTMGIVDATPVDHSMRDGGLFYNNLKASNEMDKYLSRNKHLKKNEAMVVLKSIDKR